MRKTIGLGLLVAVVSVSMLAQEDPVTQGQKLFSEKKYAGAVRVLSKAVADQPANGPGWFWLGIARYWNGEYGQAVTALRKADELGVNVPFARFALARAFVRLGDTDRAFTWLTMAADAGFGNMQQIETDSAFAPLMADDRLNEVRERIDRNANPTAYDERFRQLDFWIGEWDVFNPAGTKVGTNTISKELGGAMLLERWTNAFGSQGASINYFDPGSGMFKQQWVAQSGYNTSYEGKLVGGSMVMTGVNADMEGILTKNRMTFTPNKDGTVTQFIETFNDSTGTWTPGFRGTYRRVVKN